MLRENAVAYFEYLRKSLPDNHLALALAVIERDTAQYRKERLDKLLLELQAKTPIILPAEPTPPPQTVKEIQFSILPFIPQQSLSLGRYEVSSKPKTDFQRWLYAYNTLKLNNATIQNRFYQAGYRYSYWIQDEDKIYRQSLGGLS